MPGPEVGPLQKSMARMVRKVLYVSAECAECDFVSTHALGARVHSLATGHYVKDTRVYEVGPKK